MNILGIESSCDETAAAVVADGTRLLSSVVASSGNLHQAYGGVVPEIAARSHLESILPVIEQALKKARLGWPDIDAIAVTQGPGLIGSLLIGLLSARTLAICKNKKLLAVNHVAAHPFGAYLSSEPPALPCLVMVVSGGHTFIALMKKHGQYKMLGQTKDDAVGEAFDKVAKLLGLPYPGGPAVSHLADSGNPKKYTLPDANLPKSYDFSYSGLKTAVLRTAQAIAGKDYTLPSHELPGLLDKAQKADLAASFRAAAIDSLTTALKSAAKAYSPACIIVAGGVAAESELRRQLNDPAWICPVLTPPPELCTDNAAMIASYAYFARKEADPYSLLPKPSLSW